MRWVRCGRGVNKSGQDGRSRPRDRSVVNASPLNGYLCILFVFLSMLGSVVATDDEFYSPVIDRSSYSSGEDPYASSVSSTADTVVQSGVDEDNNYDVHHTPTRVRPAMSQDSIRETYSIKNRIVFRNHDSGAEWVTGHMFNMDKDTSSCRCEGDPDPECTVYTTQVDYVELCHGLGLDPTCPLIDADTGEELTLKYGWTQLENDDDPDFGRLAGEMQDNYKRFEQFDDTTDPWGFWSHCDVRVVFPVHRCGPFLYNIKGTSMCLDERGARVCEPNERPLRSESPELSDICSDTCNERDDTDQDMEDDEIDDDVYEDVRHIEIDAYLRFGKTPMRFNGPDGAKKKKSFKQNARRRYTLRTIDGDDEGEEVLFHVRGKGDYSKRRLGRSVPSMVRQKLFKYRRVLMRREAMETVTRDHTLNHDGHNTAEIRLNEHYFIVDIRTKVQSVGGNNCAVCAAHEPVRKKPIIPILTTRKGELVMFDLTKFYVPVRQTLYSLSF